MHDVAPALRPRGRTESPAPAGLSLSWAGALSWCARDRMPGIHEHIPTTRVIWRGMRDKLSPRKRIPNERDPKQLGLARRCALARVSRGARQRAAGHARGRCRGARRQRPPRRRGAGARLLRLRLLELRAGSGDARGPRLQRGSRSAVSGLRGRAARPAIAARAGRFAGPCGRFDRRADAGPAAAAPPGDGADRLARHRRARRFRRDGARYLRPRRRDHRHQPHPAPRVAVRGPRHADRPLRRTPAARRARAGQARRERAELLLRHRPHLHLPRERADRGRTAQRRQRPLLPPARAQAREGARRADRGRHRLPRGHAAAPVREPGAARARLRCAGGVLPDARPRLGALRAHPRARGQRRHGAGGGAAGAAASLRVPALHRLRHPPVLALAQGADGAGGHPQGHGAQREARPGRGSGKSSSPRRRSRWCGAGARPRFATGAC